MPATYTAPEIVSRLSPLARDLARVGVLAHADAAKAVAQLRRLGLGYAACRKSRALGAPPVATWSPSSDLGREVAALLGRRVDPPRVAYLLRTCETRDPACAEPVTPEPATPEPAAPLPVPQQPAAPPPPPPPSAPVAGRRPLEEREVGPWVEGKPPPSGKR